MRCTVSLIGHRGYIGRNIKNALEETDIFALNFIDRATSVSDAAYMIKNSDCVINCAAIQRPEKDSIDSFLPNFELTKFISDNINHYSKLIFTSSVHLNSETSFGYVRRMEEAYIKSHVFRFDIYHLPHTFGPYGKPNYNNVFNTFLFNFINNLPINIIDSKRVFDVVSSVDFARYIVSTISANGGGQTSYKIYKLTLIDFLHIVQTSYINNACIDDLHVSVKNACLLYHDCSVKSLDHR